MRIKNVWRKRRRRRVPQLNTVATADISFMLLIFFLVTTSIDTDRVLRRQLPPRETTREIPPKDVDRDNVITVSISCDNKLSVGSEPVSPEELESEMARFIKDKGRQHIIEIMASTRADYNTYFHLQNAIVETYRRVRDDAARSLYHMPFDRCSPQRQQEIRDRYPQRISEQFVE
ncbi:MAG: ExbD/TolR family protein [Prevotella sp.]